MSLFAFNIENVPRNTLVLVMALDFRENPTDIKAVKAGISILRVLSSSHGSDTEVK
jgi:hypothetical protein